MKAVTSKNDQAVKTDRDIPLPLPDMGSHELLTGTMREKTESFFRRSILCTKAKIVKSLSVPNW